MMKKWIAAVLCVAMLIMPLSGMTLFTATAASDGTYAVEALSFEASYGSTQDGTLDLSTVKKYDAYEQYNLRYLSDNTALSSVSGIPYQVFDVALGGKTSGTVALHYSGSTKEGERIALRAYNVRTKAWDTLGTFKGTGSVSAEVNVTTYNDGGVIHVAAVLDYETNGSNTMIWSTDPQHYTKFEDLHEYYYAIYQYAAEQYVAGNAGYIITTGDLVDDLPTTSIAPYQWSVSDRAMQYVEEVGMPNGLVAGNHDVGTFTSTDYSKTPNANYDRFWETFPASRYESSRWYGGSFENNQSHYDLITIGNVDFIVLYLGYALEATDEVIAWANDVLKTYPHRTAIVATHQYLDAIDANYANRGKLIFDKIVSPNANVKMVICGHDDGSVCREVTAADGRKVYEVLADYQFVEAEDPDFYANEHWIGSVSSCCGDGYIRLMTVEGDTLSSITYSPVTGRYNPYGESEMYSIDLDCGTPDRHMSTSRFSAAIVGSATTATNVDRITLNGGKYSAITYASVPAAPTKTDATPWPTTMYGQAATPSEPQYQHNAVTPPTVAFKVDVLQACGLGTHPVLNGRTMNFGEYALDLTVDLSTTPYLYYSFAAPENSRTTFAFINDTANAPWITFLDATKGGATMNKGAENWDSYAGNGNQYFTTSMTGCIDMRTLRTTTSNEWIVEQLNVYNVNQTNVVMSYLFFGSEPIDTVGSVFGDPATPADPVSAHVSANPPVVEEKVNVLGAVSLNDNAFIYENINYGDNDLSLKVDLNKTPYLYYSFGQKASSRFTFALVNNNVNVPWIAFLDASMGGGVMNTGADNWNNAGGKQYFTTDMTGCIDMRQYLKDPSNMIWEVEQLNLYNPDRVKVQMNYLFFGSAAPGGDDQKSVDSEALTALIKKADSISTDGMTSASATALKIAKNRAVYVDRADVIATGHAYFELAEAIGALTETYVPYNDVNNLKSVAVYSLKVADWKCNAMGVALTNSSSFITAEQSSSGGLRMKRSSAATHTWPGITYAGTNKSYSVTPYGSVYLKLNLKAQTAWAISIAVTQDGVTTNVRLNEGIVDSFYNKAGDNFYGTFNNVYDVGEAFRSFGVDPTAPFSVSGMSILSVGNNAAWNTYYHIELLTGTWKSASYSELNDTIAHAKNLTKSMYTSATWSTFSSALTKAKTASGTSGLSQPEINLANHRLKTAMSNLELASYKQPSGSLLPDDIAAWTGSDAKAKYSGNATVIENTNGTWACLDFIYGNDRRIRLDKYQLEVDMVLSDHANILVRINGEWKSISADLTDKLTGEDMKPGTYKMKIPMNELASFGDVSAVIDGIRIWSVGEVGKNAVTVNYFKITPYCDHTFDYTVAEFGAGATPSNPYMTHAAANGPNVGQKVDLLAASGIDKHDVFTSGSTSFGDQKMHLTVDLAKTPYLYYSFVQPADSKCTIGLYNDSSTAPWFTFLDANWGGAAMNKDIANWDAYSGTGASQYFQGSVTGCVDLRSLLKDSTQTQWRVNNLSVYTSGSQKAQISYLFFGSAPLDDGYEEPAYTAGDVNMDGAITSVDARMTLLYVLNITDKQYTAAQIAACDFNGDGTRNTTDVRLMLQKALGM